MPILETQKRVKDPNRANYAVFRRRRRNALLFVALFVLALISFGAYLFSGGYEEASEAPVEEVETPVVEGAPEEPSAEEEAAEQQAAEEQRAAEEQAAREAEAERRATAVPEDTTLYLTVPRLNLYNHTVRNDNSEQALDLGAAKLPSTGFPWEQEDTNTYIACHRIGWPGTESYNQCLNLPAMQQGDEIILSDTMGRVYTYRVSEVTAVSPWQTEVTKPVAGKDVVSLQTCTETPDDWWTIGPSLFGGGPESGRLVVQAERVS
jgi:sortase A